MLEALVLRVRLARSDVDAPRIEAPLDDHSVVCIGEGVPTVGEFDVFIVVRAGVQRLSFGSADDTTLGWTPRAFSPVVPPLPMCIHAHTSYRGSETGHGIGRRFRGQTKSAHHREEQDHWSEPRDHGAGLGRPPNLFSC
jgi:hypothetical protein